MIEENAQEQIDRVQRIKGKKFMEEFHELLVKYGAEITADDHWTGYSECGQDVRMTVEFNNYLTEDIDLGSRTE
jgi:hypothetical protein